MKQANAYQRYFTTEDTVLEWNVPVKPGNNSVVEFVDTCIVLSQL